MTDNPRFTKDLSDLTPEQAKQASDLIMTLAIYHDTTIAFDMMFERGGINLVKDLETNDILLMDDYGRKAGFAKDGYELDAYLEPADFGHEDFTDKYQGIAGDFRVLNRLDQSYNLSDAEYLHSVSVIEDIDLLCFEKMGHTDVRAFGDSLLSGDISVTDEEIDTLENSRQMADIFTWDDVERIREMNAENSQERRGYINDVSPNGIVVGEVSWANGEKQSFTDSDLYIQMIESEIEYVNTSGFSYNTLTSDPIVRKAVDDILYNLFGEENPHSIEEYAVSVEKNNERNLAKPTAFEEKPMTTEEVAAEENNHYAQRQQQQDREATEGSEMFAYEKPRPPKDVLQIPTPADNNQGAVDYLMEKGIDADIIADCIDKGLIYQSVADGRVSEELIVFASRDEDGAIQRLSGDVLNWDTDLENPSAHDFTGSDLSYPFVLDGGKDASKVFLFEDPMEALSHATILKINGWDTPPVHRVVVSHEGNTLESADELGYVFKNQSLDGLSRFLDENSNITTIVPCFEDSSNGYARAVQVKKTFETEEISVTDPQAPKDGNSFSDVLLNCPKHGIASQHSQSQVAVQDDVMAMDIDWGAEM